EQIGQVVAQDVACGADRVLAADDTLERVAHRAHVAHDLNVQPGGVVLVQVHPDLGDQLRLVRAISVQPEHHLHARIASAGDRQHAPITYGGGLDLAHAQDVTCLPVLAHQHFARFQVGDVGHAVFGDVESPLVRAVF